VDERADAEPVMPDPVASADGGNDPVADWLAQRLVEAGPAEPPDTLVRVLRLLGRWDRLTYVAVAGMSTPLLDEPMRIVSRVADHSKPWFAGSRRRPDRLAMRVPVRRWVPMPSSTSFPSGHAASAAAFAVAVGDVFPRLRLPLGVAAAIVGFSRVYTGVHYPGDVVIGAVTGAVIGRATSRLAVRITRPS
jgi:undecaprenyl-diphosphatase